MISNKTILAYKKAVQNINKAVEKEIDSFEIDYDKVVQKFSPIYLGDEKCECVIIKHNNKYNYDVKFFSTDTIHTILYCAEFRISEHTGKAIVYELKVLNI